MEDPRKIPERVFGNEYRYFLICIDRANGCILSGSYYNPYLSFSRSFADLTGLVLGIDRLLDEMGTVSRWRTPRSFAEKIDRESESCDNSICRKGAIATFSINILFRRNASWQGSISWLEGNAKKEFRSVLELLSIICSACIDGNGVKK